MDRFRLCDALVKGVYSAVSDVNRYVSPNKFFPNGSKRLFCSRVTGFMIIVKVPDYLLANVRRYVQSWYLPASDFPDQAVVHLLSSCCGRRMVGFLDSSLFVVLLRLLHYTIDAAAVISYSSGAAAATLRSRLSSGCIQSSS